MPSWYDAWADRYGETPGAADVARDDTESTSSSPLTLEADTIRR